MSLNDFGKFMATTYGRDWSGAYAAADPIQAYWLMLRSKADRAHALAMMSAQYGATHNPQSNVYVYYFNQHPPDRNDEFYGSLHSSDLWYFFNSMRNEPGQRLWTDQDHRMASYLANFIRVGNPNGKELPKWPRIGVQPAFIRFADGEALSMLTAPYPIRDAINSILTKSPSLGIDLPLRQPRNVRYRAGVCCSSSWSKVPIERLFRAFGRTAVRR